MTGIERENLDRLARRVDAGEYAGDREVLRIGITPDNTYPYQVEHAMAYASAALRHDDWLRERGAIR